jgi:biopolymer transport protein ExbD
VRRRRLRRLESAPGELMLAAMVDMMINLLIFLLHLYGTTPVEVKPTADLQFPQARVADPMQAGRVVRVTHSGVEIDGQPTVRYETVDGRLGFPAASLRDGQLGVLADFLVQQAGKPEESSPEILVQCDKRVPWSVLGVVVRTAGESGYPKMRFVVAHDEGEEPTAPGSGG